MAVITISRQYGSGGDEIAELICRATGYRLFDKDIMAKAAFDAGLSSQEGIDFCEDNYKMKNLFDRLFAPAKPVAQVRVWKEGTDGVRTVERLALDEEHALACTRKAVETAYQVGNIVIVGRGGQMILAGRPGVLHVRVIAQLEDRLLNVRNLPQLTQHAYSDSVEARRAAQNSLEKHDAASADYLRRFYGVDWSDLNLYHMVINTSKVTHELAAQFILAAAEKLQLSVAHS